MVVRPGILADDCQTRCWGDKHDNLRGRNARTAPEGRKTQTMAGDEGAWTSGPGRTGSLVRSE